MLTTEQINDLHRLYWSDHWPIRKIERHLHMGWETIKKYLDMPAQTPAGRPRSSKLDPYKATIAELLEKDPSASAAVIGQRLQPLGYTGGDSILRQYVHEVRPQLKPQRAFVRMEPKPGERFEVDWGHFESLDYQGDQRKLYAFALVDGHSRMQYLEFTHSQSFETFVRCHVHAFQMLNGIARELWYDNLATAVAEHDGRLVRFNPRFLAFAREFNFYPRACNQASGWEKGKVERGGSLCASLNAFRDVCASWERSVVPSWYCAWSCTHSRDSENAVESEYGITPLGTAFWTLPGITLPNGPARAESTSGIPRIP